MTSYKELIRVQRKIWDYATMHTLLNEADDPCLTEDIIKIRRRHDFYCLVREAHMTMKSVWRKGQMKK